MRKKPSIHDIARELGVSSATISFVLNGKAKENRIKVETERKILDYIQEIQFRPNRLAKGLRTGKSNTIAMLVEDISDPFFSAIARIVEEKASAAGYTIFNVSTENDPETVKHLLRVLRERQVDAYIIAPTPGMEGDIQQLAEDNIPVILFDRNFPGLDTTNVLIDNRQGAYNAARHLLENGYSNVGFVTVISEQVQMLDRLSGYSNAIKEYRKALLVVKIAHSGKNEENVEAIKNFIQHAPQLDAVFFATNYLTFAGLQAINELSRSIPDDVAIVSFDDNRFFSLHSPPITAVAQPVEAISHEIIRQLKLRLNDTKGKIKNETIVLKTRLIERASSFKKTRTRIGNIEGG